MGLEDFPRAMASNKLTSENGPTVLRFGFSAHERSNRYQQNTENGDESPNRKFSSLNSCRGDRNKGNGLWIARHEKIDAIIEKVNTGHKCKNSDHHAYDDHRTCQKRVQKHKSPSRNLKRHSKAITSTRRWKALRLAALRRDGFRLSHPPLAGLIIARSRSRRSA